MHNLNHPPRMGGFSLLFITLLVLYSSASAEIIHDNFYSASLLENRQIDIYLPPGYHSSAESYSVVYFLHGMSSEPADYSFMLNVILDGMISAGGLDPIIAAVPDGRDDFYAGSMYTNSDLYGLFEDYIASDVIQYVETHYRALGDRAHRAIMGHSMGGFGATSVAFRHPDLFYAVASLSGFVSIYPFEFWRSQVLAENGGQAPYNYDINSGWFTLASVTAAGAFSPNLDNPPYMVDLPLDVNGNVVPVVRDIWYAYMPGSLARLNPNVRNLDIYFDCGRQDELGFYPMTEFFHAQLDSQDIIHRFDSYDGTHTSQLSLRGMLAFLHLDSARNQLAVDKPASSFVPSRISLLQNYPNPFNATTQIEFTLPVSGNARLVVYDLLGREVVVLTDGFISAGTHAMRFDGNGLASGIYLCRMDFSGQSQVRKMLLLR